MNRDRVVLIAADANDFERLLSRLCADEEKLTVLAHSENVDFREVSDCYTVLTSAYEVKIRVNPPIPRYWELRKDGRLERVFSSKSDVLTELRCLGVPDERLKSLRKVTVAALRRYIEEGSEDAEAHSITTEVEREGAKTYVYKLTPSVLFPSDAVTLRIQASSRGDPQYFLSSDWSKVIQERRTNIEEMLKGYTVINVLQYA